MCDIPNLKLLLKRKGRDTLGRLESNLLEGPNLTSESISDSCIQKGNFRVWKAIDSVPKKVLKSIKEMVVEGDEDDEVFEGIIKDLEVRD